MNKRQRKKNYKNYHKQFCYKPSDSYQCPKCGWDSAIADEEIKLGKIISSRGGFYDYYFEVEYKCPVCGTVFSYTDGV